MKKLALLLPLTVARTSAGGGGVWFPSPQPVFSVDRALLPDSRSVDFVGPGARAHDRYALHDLGSCCVLAAGIRVPPLTASWVPCSPWNIVQKRTLKGEAGKLSGFSRAIL